MVDYDLVVIGGGAAGLAAARTGARRGARTLLVHDGTTVARIARTEDAVALSDEGIDVRRGRAREVLPIGLVPHLGRLPLGDLRVHHVDGMLDAIRTANATSARPVGPATQRRIIATLRSALSDAVKSRLLSWNPAGHAKIGKATRPKVDPWSTTEVGAFLDSVAGELGHLAVFSGLRRGELCGLRWSDVELNATRSTDCPRRRRASAPKTLTT